MDGSLKQLRTGCKIHSNKYLDPISIYGPRQEHQISTLTKYDVVSATQTLSLNNHISSLLKKGLTSKMHIYKQLRKWVPKLTSSEHRILDPLLVEKLRIINQSRVEI